MAAKKTKASESKTQQKPASHSPVYVGIYEPDMLQRYVLEATKSTIMLTKIYDELQEIRSKKKHTVQAFEKSMSELVTLHAKFKSHLPSDLSGTKAIAAPKAVSQTPQKAETKTVAPAQIDQMDQELAEIERMLGQLSK